MRYAAITDRLDGLAGAKWAVHALARQMAADGQDIIELTIGEPDVPTPAALIAVAAAAMAAGRTGYSNGRGEPELTRALAARYTARRGRVIGADQVICLPASSMRVARSRKAPSYSPESTRATASPRSAV